MNAFSEGMSGGDLRFIEVMKRLNTYYVTVITSFMGWKACEERGLAVNHALTSSERSFKSLILTYFRRTVMASTMQMDLTAGDVLYSSSDFLPDVFPAYVLKGKKRSTRWVVLLHLVAPDPFRGYEGRQSGGKSWSRSVLRDMLFKLGQLGAIRLIRSSADLILVVNPDIRDYLISKGVDGRKIIVVRNGTDLDLVRKVRPGNAAFDAVYVGRLHAQKGIPDLLRIRRSVCEKRKGSKLAVVGRGSALFERRLTEDIVKSGLEENIKVMGHLADEEKLGVLKSSRVLLFPSYYESFGIVILESMACGVPVVCYDLPPLRGLFPKGLVRVPVGDMDRFAEETMKILGDDSLREKLSHEGSEFAEACDWGLIAEKEEEIIGRPLP